MKIPVCVHLGWGCPALTEIFDASTNFHSAILPVLMGFFSIFRSDVLDSVPDLKFAFLESGSLWIPYLLDQVKRSRKSKKDPAAYFREGRVFVSCESNEDINYLTSLIGEDSLMASSDYPHADPFHEENMVQAFMGRDDLQLRVQEKLLSTNAKNLYGL